VRRACSLLIAILVVPAAAGEPCSDLPGAVTVESARYVIHYRTRPDRIAIGQHFMMDLAVCPRAESRTPAGSVRAEDVRVDARMPEHRHGMNYRTTVKAAEGGRYLAEGFMFHMPGRWQFVFEVRADGRPTG
jgi:hypothetical protein